MAKPTEEELLILNTIMYSDDFAKYDFQDGHLTILDWANQYDPKKKVGGEISSEEMQKVANTIKANPDVYGNMVIKDFDRSQYANESGSQRVKNATIDYGNDRIVVYCGTAGDIEWNDNGLGGHANVTDTEQQMRALGYFDKQMEDFNGKGKVYVTGHSKGGNKAQYITVLRGDMVDGCVSFDGQGFGDAFQKKYAKQIKANKGKMTSISNELDFVNILFFRITGNTKFISAGEGPVGGILDNGLGYFKRWHTPYTMFHENDDGTLSLGEETEQSDLMKYVEGLLDHYATYMSEEDFNYFVHMLMNSFIGDEQLKNYDYTKPDGFEERFMSLTKGYLEMNGLDPVEILPVLFLLTGSYDPSLPFEVTALYASIPSYGYTNTLRDFTDSAKQNLLSIVKEVEDEPFWDVTKWDVWYRVEKLFGGVDFPQNSSNLHKYYKKMIDMNETTASKVEEIFNNVYNLESDYNKTLEGFKDKADSILTDLKKISGSLLI